MGKTTYNFNILRKMYSNAGFKSAVVFSKQNNAWYFQTIPKLLTIPTADFALSTNDENIRMYLYSHSMAPIKHSTVNFIIPIFLTVMINHKTNLKKPRKDKLK